jgi:glutamine synthetase
MRRNYTGLVFPDLTGSARMVVVPKKRTNDAVENGLFFDGSSVGFRGVEDSDLMVKPDPERSFKWFDGSTRIMCDVLQDDGKDFELCSRMTLKGVAANGYQALIAPEVEFFLKRDGKPIDSSSYFSTHLNEAVLDMVPALEKTGIRVLMAHHEVAEGQYEIGFKHSHAVESADNVLIYKDVLRHVSSSHNLSIDFNPKPFRGMNGSGMHCHVSLWKDGENIFWDRDGLSEKSKYFIAGLLDHSSALCAIVSPTENSYDRLVPGAEAPVKVCWGFRNRSALVRVPTFSSPDSARIEFRLPDPSCNQYLAFAAVLEAGLDGMKRKLTAEAEPNNAYKKDLPPLPSSLEKAREALGENKVLSKYLKFMA